MSDALSIIARLAADPAMQQRVAAAIAQQHSIGLPCPSPEEVEGEAYRLRLAWAASPQWAERYEYALNTDNPEPGTDPAVISDGDIVAWVQAQWPEQQEPTPLPEGD